MSDLREDFFASGRMMQRWIYANTHGDADGYTVDAVTTTEEHECPGNFVGGAHPIPVGTLAVREHALVNGAWATCYTCEDCVQRWRQESGL